MSSGSDPCIVSAYSLTNALGLRTDDVLGKVFSGVVGHSDAPFSLPFSADCGVVPGLERRPGLVDSRYDNRALRIALAAYDEIEEDIASTLNRVGPSRVGLIVGTSTGGIDRSEARYAERESGVQGRGDYNFLSQHSFGGFLEALRAVTGVLGPSCVVSTACSSSAKALGAAQRWMSAGYCDAVLVCGVDALCQTTLRGFHALGVLSGNPCRPFCADRDGIHLGEGAAWLVLERRGPNGVARLLSVGESTDAYSMSAPHPAGDGVVLAIQQSLASAKLEADHIDYVNAHGTGTQKNDIAEAIAIGSALGNVPTSSTKSMTGHLLGAAGATEAVITIATLERGLLPPSVASAPIDPQISIPIVTEPTSASPKHAMSLSMAFGGSNAAVVLGCA